MNIIDFTLTRLERLSYWFMTLALTKAKTERDKRVLEWCAGWCQTQCANIGRELIRRELRKPKVIRSYDGSVTGTIGGLDPTRDERGCFRRVMDWCWDRI